MLRTGRGKYFVLGNNLFPENPSFTPKWSDKPLLKSHEKSKPPLGCRGKRIRVPALCAGDSPTNCRRQQDYRVLLNERPGEIKAQIIERDGKILMVKDCPVHGHFEDVISIDPQFFRHLEETFPAGISVPTTTKNCTTTEAAPSSTGEARFSPST